tara:strand:- start:495 stop:617 length:123 start_codon:yes stop_codon:yes gene_type:complete
MESVYLEGGDKAMQDPMAVMQDPVQMTKKDGESDASTIVS